MPGTIETTPPLPDLSPVNGKTLTARFDGGSLSSDAGLLALHEVERRLGVADRLAACIDDADHHPVAVDMRDPEAFAGSPSKKRSSASRGSGGS